MIFCFSTLCFYIRIEKSQTHERSHSMKKIIKTLTTLFTAALAVAGGLLIYQKFFRKEEELEEDFDDEDDI